MDFFVTPTMPTDASGGGDFVTGLTPQRIEVRIPGGGTDTRLERVLVTSKAIIAYDPPPLPGRVCFTERTIVAWAREFGMVTESDVAALRSDLAEARAEVAMLSARLAGALREIESLRDVTDPRTVYVAADGTEWATKATCESQNAFLRRDEEAA